MRNALYIAIVAALFAIGFYAFNNYIYSQKQGDARPVLSHKDASYIIDGKRIELLNGVSELDIVPGSESKLVTRYFGNEVASDLDGDGSEDIAFLLAQEGAGTSILYYLVGALKRENGYEGTQGAFLGEGISPQTTEKGKGRIVVVNYALKQMQPNSSTSPSVGKSLWLLLDPQTLSWGEVVQDFEGEADPSRMSLTDRSWSWVAAEYGGDALIAVRDPKRFSITFDEDGSFSATTDCNSMGGAYATTGDSITFSDVFSTKMFCEDSQETVFAKVLSDAKTYRFTSKGELILDFGADHGTATFK